MFVNEHSTPELPALFDVETFEETTEDRLRALSSKFNCPELDALPFAFGRPPCCIYAGIGSRETPPEILAKMTAVARRLEARGYSLLTGDASGADAAFAAGVERLKSVFTAKDATPRSIAIARALHPNPSALSPYALRLMARNAFQVFGANLVTPVDFALCWTPDGAESHAQRSRKTGGTGQAISLGSLRGVPVINMKNEGWGQRVAEILEATTARISK